MTEKKSKRGGARPGSGPKPKPQEEKSVSFIVSCTREELVKINELAEQAGVPRSHLILEAFNAYAMETAFVQYALAMLPRISEESREILREALANVQPIRPVLQFDDERRIVRWDGGHCPFSSKAVLRYRLVKELYFSESGKLSAAEIGELLYDDDLKDWDAIRVLGGSTETKNLEPAECPYMIETEKQGLRILKRCEAITLRVW